MMRRLAAWGAVCASALVAATGCGGGVRASPEAHVVALANATCREYNARSGTANNLSQARKEEARIRAILTPAASDPRVGTFLKDVAARERLLSRLYSPGLTEAVLRHLYLDLQRATLEVHEDAKALGLTSCFGPRS
jgi:hypothetical protein